MTRPCSSLRKLPCESVAGTAFLTVIVRPSIASVTLRSKSAAVTLSIRIRCPSTSRANRLSSPSIVRSSTGESLMAGVFQDLEVVLRVVERRRRLGLQDGLVGVALDLEVGLVVVLRRHPLTLQAGEAREVGHRPPQRREVGDG